MSVRLVQVFLELSIFIFLAQIFKLTSCELQAFSQRPVSSQSEVSQKSFNEIVIQLVIILSEPQMLCLVNLNFCWSVPIFPKFSVVGEESESMESSSDADSQADSSGNFLLRWFSDRSHHEKV